MAQKQKQFRLAAAANMTPFLSFFLLCIPFPLFANGFFI
jgi:hypothetical protein